MGEQVVRAAAVVFGPRLHPHAHTSVCVSHMCAHAFCSQVEPIAKAHRNADRLEPKSPEATRNAFLLFNTALVRSLAR